MQEPAPSVTADLPLRFPGLLVVVGGGSFDLTLLHHLSAAGAALVGADGGGDAIAEAALVPTAIIGDLDSLADPSDWGPETRLLRISEQDTTDFEKVLYSTEAPLTVALGTTGKRFDHTLAALSAVTRYGRDRRIVLMDEHDLALCLSGDFTFAADKGQRVSIHPLTPVRFLRSTGLAYPLDGLTLSPGGRLGTSNEALGGPFTIEPDASLPGVFLLILDRSHLDAIAEAVLAEAGT